MTASMTQYLNTYRERLSPKRLVRSNEAHSHRLIKQQKHTNLVQHSHTRKKTTTFKRGKGTYPSPVSPQQACMCQT